MLAKTVEISAQYARLQARFREGIYGGIDVTGNNVPAVPKDRFSANFGWQVAAGTRLNFNLVYVGDQIYDNDQANRFRKMPSYGIADIKLSRDFGNWRLAAGVNNLFDEKYYTYGVVNSTYNSFIAYPEDRRNAYVSAEYRF
jgi:iron complex outermembrane receptor protein